VTDNGLARTGVVLAVALCCSTVCCAAGVYALADQGLTVQLESGTGIAMIVLGLLVWLAPPLAWSRLTARDVNGMNED
jgi:predicted phage tail protein